MDQNAKSTNQDSTVIKTVEKIEAAVTEGMGSPSQGIPASATQSALMNIMLRMIEEGEIPFETLVKNVQEKGDSLNSAKKIVASISKNIEKKDGKASDKVSTIAVELVLGEKQIAAISKEAGIPPNEVSTELVELLPKIVEKFTPDGNMPDPTAVRQAASLLRSKIS
ncbi:MAG TPA: YidB family protein [Candidatus Kapabacteria bacterium]|jgi:hypothetical protein|nr:YidB family protein [Candidatus Kapabacteria bacterium]